MKKNYSTPVYNRILASTRYSSKSQRVFVYFERSVGS